MCPRTFRTRELGPSDSYYNHGRLTVFYTHDNIITIDDDS